MIDTGYCVRCDGTGQLNARAQAPGDAPAEPGSRPCPRCKGAGLEMVVPMPRSPLLEVYVVFEDETEARAFMASLEPSGLRHGIRVSDRRQSQFGDPRAFDSWA